MSREWEVTTSRGTARVLLDAAESPWCRLVLGHGAGGGAAASDLETLARRLPALGVSVWRVEQPWRLAGRRVAPAPSVLDDAWAQVVQTVPRDLPLVLGGRSAGARVACRTSDALRAVAVVALAFPLHPPGRPERSRADELLAVQVPTLVVQGLSDAFGAPGEFPTAPQLRMVEVAGDHALRADPDAVASAVAQFLTAAVRPTPPDPK